VLLSDWTCVAWVEEWQRQHVPCIVSLPPSCRIKKSPTAVSWLAFGIFNGYSAVCKIQERQVPIEIELSNAAGKPTLTDRAKRASRRRPQQATARMSSFLQVKEFRITELVLRRDFRLLKTIFTPPLPLLRSMRLKLHFIHTTTLLHFC
jgi:hypothetical protein